MEFAQREKIRKAWGLPMRNGSIRIRAVNCGKPNCKSCPHSYYLYFREEKNYKIKERYLGKCDKEGMPR